MKTPEEMAEEALKGVPIDSEWGNGCYNGFLAGYKAAQEHAHAALEEAEARIVELQDTIIESQEKLNQMRLERPVFKKHEIENLLSQTNADGYTRGYERGLIAQKCWIGVDESLPKDEQETVLVLISGDGWHDHDVAYRAFGKWYDKYDDILEGVTHWQELPEPPKEEE